MSRITEFLSGRFPESYAHHLGELLSAFNDSGLASPHFVEEVVSGDERKLWSRLWEAMLHRHLLSLGFTLHTVDIKKSGERGPDFGIVHQGKTIWVEAVTPSPEGIPASYLKPPKKGEVELKPVLYEEKLLRWTSVLRDKRKKMESYRKQNVIGETDCTIIAVNSCRLQDYAPHDLGSSRLPFSVEAVFPIGPLAYPITLHGQPDGEPANIPRYTIQKPNSAAVPTDNFLDPHYANISAMIGVWQKDMLSGSLSLTLVHNPLATIPLPRAILGAKKEYVADQKVDHYVLRLLSEKC